MLPCFLQSSRYWSTSPRHVESHMLAMPVGRIPHRTFLPNHTCPCFQPCRKASPVGGGGCPPLRRSTSRAPALGSRIVVTVAVRRRRNQSVQQLSLHLWNNVKTRADPHFDVPRRCAASLCVQKAATRPCVLQCHPQSGRVCGEWLRRRSRFAPYRRSFSPNGARTVDPTAGTAHLCA